MGEAQIGLSDQASERDTVMAATKTGCLDVIKKFTKRPSGSPRQTKRILSTVPESSTLLTSTKPSSPPLSLYVSRERERERESHESEKKKRKKKKKQIQTRTPTQQQGGRERERERDAIYYYYYCCCCCCFDIDIWV